MQMRNVCTAKHSEKESRPGYPERLSIKTDSEKSYSENGTGFRER